MHSQVSQCPAGAGQVSQEPKWLTLPAILVIHQRLLFEFAGAEGVRDQGLLESALWRPRQQWHDERPDLFDLEASYAFGIVTNHPFIDGNKRTALTAAFVFLDLNGREWGAPEAKAVVMTVG